MGLFDFFKRKSADSAVNSQQSIKRESEQQTDIYAEERDRILHILTEQLARFPNSRAAVPLTYFLKYTDEFDSDYAHTMSCHCCCEKCSPYRQRYYSISGKDKRVPKIPDFFLDIRNWEHCRVDLKPETRISLQVTPELIPESNRPFIDDRTPEQKQNYQNYLAEQQAEAEKIQDKVDYQILLDKFPEIAPKSFGAYRRLKNSNPDKFNELRQELH